MNNQLCKLHIAVLVYAVFDISHDQGLIDPRSGERACNSAYACRDGEVLVVTNFLSLKPAQAPSKMGQNL